MSKTCAICETVLLSTLNEYGDVNKPVCQECFLNPAEALEQKQDELSDLEDEITEADQEFTRLSELAEEQEYHLRELKIRRRKLLEQKDQAENNKFKKFVGPLFKEFAL